jgi:tetratricopeptide repeat protein 8
MSAFAATPDATTAPGAGLDPAYYALSLLRRRRLDQCVEHTTGAMNARPQQVDLQLWWAKARALTNQSWFDDTEMEEADAGDALVESNAAATSAARPGTSLLAAPRAGGRPPTTTTTSTLAPRASSGFARPSSRMVPGSSAGAGAPGSSLGALTGSRAGLQTSRPSTTRPITSSGRFVRLGTASLLASGDENGPFVDPDRLDMKKFATERPTQARVLCDYLVYHAKHMRKAAELAAEAANAASRAAGGANPSGAGGAPAKPAAAAGDWWWCARLGKAYYYLGLHRDADQQLRASMRMYPCVATVLELGKVMMRLDQPLALIDLLHKAAVENPASTHLVIGSARLHDMLQNQERALEYDKKALAIVGGHVEGLACLATHYFHADQPELSLRLYRRLLQMGVQSCELWNNLGLCCLHASQYDTALAYLCRALTAARNDVEASEVWYNVAHVAVSLGDIGTAYQALKVAVSLNPKHAEALNNLGVLAMRAERLEQARGEFAQATSVSDRLHEALYNAALLHWQLGEVQDAARMCDRSLDVYPDHWESLELKREITKRLMAA